MENYKNINPVRVDKTQIINLERGKLPPQAVDIEESVLGALMIDSRTIDECMLIIKTEDVFYKECNQCVFKAIQELFNENTAIDLMTVSAKLRALGLLERAGGDYYLVQLSQKMSSGAHIEYHSRLLLQFYIKRQVIRHCSVMMANAYDDTYDSLELLNDWSTHLDEVNVLTMNGKTQQSFAELLDNVEKRVEFLSHKDPDEVTGVYTGFKKIDLFTGGYQPGELIVCAARPGMGKTSKILKTVVANAKKDVPVGFISLEMSAPQLATRIVSIDTDFHLNQLLKTGFDKPSYFQSFSKHKHRMNGYPIYIDDDGASSDIRDIISTFRLWKRKYDIKIGIIDYIQLCGDKTKGNNREQEISSISRKLKLLAKELQIPIVALSQLSRKVEDRGGDKRPKLSDLRESGAIEQDADIIEFIYRPEYYGFEVEEELMAMDCNAEIHFAKYRNGGLETKGLKWIGDKTKFLDPSDETEYTHLSDDDDDKLPTPSANEAFGPDNDTPY